MWSSIPARPPLRTGLLRPVLFLLAVFLPLSVAADPASALSGPVRVELKDGRSFSGRAIAFREDVLLLRRQLDRGEVDQGFPRAQIARVHFPGEAVVAEAQRLVDDGESAEAIPHLEAIWRQRLNFLPLLGPEIAELLAALPAAHLETGDPYRAISLARNLLPHAGSPSAADRLYETILLSHYQLEFYEETEQLAREWLRLQEDFPASALGWKMLAELALRKEDFDQVAWIALQPIALAGPEPKRHLDGCYALAIHAFHQREEFQRATRLHREMIDRGLSWPPDEALAQTGEFYRAQIAAQMARRLGGEPDLDLRPPEEDLNLPLEKVRKILRPEDP